MLRVSLLAAMIGVAGATSSCALLTKSDPVVPRYFTPELPKLASPSTAAAGTPQLSVRLGRVGGGSYLKERIVYRDSDQEFGFYEDRRWTERPEVYLQRALEESLFEQGGLRRALGSTAPTLTADLIEFEEVRGTIPHVRLRVSYALHDEQTVFFEHTLSIERPLPAGPELARTARVAGALGEALRESAVRITTDVVSGLSPPAGRSP